MAEDIENDDQWLYGENPELETSSKQVAPMETNGNDETQGAEAPETNNDTSETNNVDVPPEEEPAIPESNNEVNESTAETTQDSELNQNGEGSDNDKEDYDEDSDDDVNVVIGDFKTTPAYSSLNIKRGGLLTTTSKGDKPQVAQPGKFSLEEFEQAGMINGIAVSDFNVDSLEDKPWRKPGSDITDYFNYGFNEDTWRAYCERQKRMRVNESGTGLLPLNSIGMPRTPISIMNDNSKYAANYLGLRKAGPPPARRMTGAIDVIGGSTITTTTSPGIPIPKVVQPKENVIQVMTADRREYSRKPPAFPDMSVPPPNFEEFIPELNFNPEPEPFYGGYEPTQDVQWGTEPNPTWQPQEIKTLTPTSPGPIVIPPVMVSPAPGISDESPVVPSAISPVVERERSPPPARRSRSRERESSRREIDRPREAERTHSRIRERSHRRERSRSRSRRHKSRSRSQSHSSHRSHRRKKSRRHDESD